MSFSLWLKEQIEERKMSFSEFARESKVSRSTIKRIINNEISVVRENTLEKLESYLECSFKKVRIEEKLNFKDYEISGPNSIRIILCPRCQKEKITHKIYLNNSLSTLRQNFSSDKNKEFCIPCYLCETCIVLVSQLKLLEFDLSYMLNHYKEKTSLSNFQIASEFKVNVSTIYRVTRRKQRTVNVRLGVQILKKHLFIKEPLSDAINNEEPLIMYIIEKLEDAGYFIDSLSKKVYPIGDGLDKKQNSSTNLANDIVNSVEKSTHSIVLVKGKTKVGIALVDKTNRLSIFNFLDDHSCQFAFIREPFRGERATTFLYQLYDLREWPFKKIDALTFFKEKKSKGISQEEQSIYSIPVNYFLQRAAFSFSKYRLFMIDIVSTKVRFGFSLPAHHINVCDCRTGLIFSKVIYSYNESPKFDVNAKHVLITLFKIFTDLPPLRQDESPLFMSHSSKVLQVFKVLKLKDDFQYIVPLKSYFYDWPQFFLNENKLEIVRRLYELQFIHYTGEDCSLFFVSLAEKVEQISYIFYKKCKNNETYNSSKELVHAYEKLINDEIQVSENKFGYNVRLPYYRDTYKRFDFN
jgi:transcriptional regulator with XRE-family HTH domain